MFKLNRELGLLVSSIDFIQRKNGELVFLEINPIGDWNWIEKQTNLPITKSMFDFVNDLLNKKRNNMIHKGIIFLDLEELSLVHF